MVCLYFAVSIASSLVASVHYQEEEEVEVFLFHLDSIQLGLEAPLKSNIVLAER